MVVSVYRRNWYPTNGLYEIDGVDYAFDQSGYMITGWWQDDYENYYYFDLNSGAMQKGWVYGTVHGTIWIRNTDSCTMMDSIRLTEQAIFLTPNGSMASGWYFYDNDPDR